ncbi:hypothetical protein, partial [Sulfurimonas indica]|uniref:hypothetical protein n=1 Tax=Sulfurimonas indica TaxID=2508707 RepID=UPI001CB728F0
NLRLDHLLSRVKSTHSIEWLNTKESHKEMLFFSFLTCLVFSDLCSLNIDYVKGVSLRGLCFLRDFSFSQGRFFAEGGA